MHSCIHHAFLILICWFRYFQWVFNKIQAASTSEGKVYLLNAMLDTLKSDHTQFTEMIPVCVGAILHVLTFFMN